MEDRQKIARNVKIFALTSLTLSVLAIIPLIGPLFNIASWILYIIVFYKLKVHAGAKKLFINFFSIVGIVVLGVIIEIILRYAFHDQDITILVVEFLLYVIVLAVSYKFAKNMFYEIARVTHQKYFIKAFYMYFIGMLTIFLVFPIILIFIGFIYHILAWIKFKSFDEEIEINNTENQIDLNSKK
ncbi:hypothetical protein [Campylobacter taeniopygiae]|uniref:DUF996 domain-containing protein n=1 Tax=Campylobacter taeniopygiae TaxID=2510188 RepID=A0ABY2TLE5_9BACT|nr:hypothetical protein [Campylobacter taeniopygiae]TKX34723.1 hypothetical protein CQA75_00280 [Campylobacter taeniopygiae]